MFDEDEMGYPIEQYVIVDGSMFVDQADEAMQEPPFDAHNVFSLDPYVFGSTSSSDQALVGRMVRFTGELVQNAHGVLYETAERHLRYALGIGMIVSYQFGRVVIAFETTGGYLYLGWVNPEDFAFVDILDEVSLWKH